MPQRGRGSPSLFCIRAQQLGAELHFVPEAVLHLRNRDTFKGLYRQSVDFAEFNAIVAKRYWRPEDRCSAYWKNFLLDWVRLIRRMRAVRREAGKFRFAWDLGRQVGRTKGILKRRAVPV